MSAQDSLEQAFDILRDLEGAPDRLQEVVADWVADHVEEPLRRAQRLLEDAAENEDDSLTEDGRATCRRVLEGVEELLVNSSSLVPGADESLRDDLKDLALYTDELGDLAAGLDDEVLAADE
jgi:hypothetical protein